MNGEGRPIDLGSRGKRVDLRMDQLPYGHPIHPISEPINDPTSESGREWNMGGYEIWRAEDEGRRLIGEGSFFTDEFRNRPGAIYEVQNGVAVKTRYVMIGMKGQDDIIVQDPSKVGMPSGRATIMP